MDVERIIAMFDDAISDFRLAADYYRELDDEGKKKVRHRIYQRYGRYGHHMFKGPTSPLEKFITSLETDHHDYRTEEGSGKNT